MKNPAIKPSSELNAFTEKIVEAIKEKRNIKVFLRDDHILYTEYMTHGISDPDFPKDGESFIYKFGQKYLIWDNDGTSIHSNDYDMTEILE